MFQYGKRLAPGRDVFLQPPAKRVLFQRGPALKSRFGDISSPGGLHYQTTAIEEDRPENLRDAAAKALEPGIVTAAEHDTAAFLTLFAERVASLPMRPENPAMNPIASARLGASDIVREPSRESARTGSAGAAVLTAANVHARPSAAAALALAASKADNPSMACVAAGVGVADLYCEEEIVGIDDEDEENVANDSGETTEDGAHMQAHRQRYSEDAEDTVATVDEADDEDEDNNQRVDVAKSDSDAALSEPSAPRPPWYASAERAALEHCAAVLRRIAHEPVPSSAAARRQRLATSATTRLYEPIYVQPPALATQPDAPATVSAPSPPRS
jgi:hypothetical protein